MCLLGIRLPFAVQALTGPYVAIVRDIKPGPAGTLPRQHGDGASPSVSVAVSVSEEGTREASLSHRLTIRFGGIVTQPRSSGSDSTSNRVLTGDQLRDCANQACHLRTCDSS